jgi:hypothetical protein
MVGFANVPDED